MEYSRHRKRRKRNGGGAARVLVALVMLAAIAYLISVSAAGSWIAENVIAPVFKSINTVQGSTDAQAVQEETASQEVSLSQDEKNSASEDMTLPAVSCFALQMGVYSNKSNADAQAETLQSLGAGGYVAEDDGRYRVFAAGYSDEADAKEVKDRLISEGMDCTLYNMQAASATFRVTALEEQLSDIQHGFEALSTAQTALCEATLAFDKEHQTVETGKAVVRKILDTLNNDMAVLSGLSASSDALHGLNDCYTQCAAELEALLESSADSTTAFSAELKYAQLSLTNQYAALLNNLSA